MGLKIFLEACLLIVLALVTTGQETKFDVREFGAKADGMADDTRVINFIFLYISNSYTQL